LESPELDRDLIRLEGLVRRQELRVAGIEAIQFDDPVISAQLPAARELLADLNQQWQEKKKEKESLLLRAPRAGIVFAPAKVPRPTRHDLELEAWYGHPMEARNAGCYLERGTLFAWIGDRTKREALAVVDDTNVGRVRPGADVNLLITGGNASLIKGKVIQVSERNLEVVPDELLAPRKLAAREDAFGRTRLLNAAYQVRIALRREAGESPLSPDQIVQGLSCRAEIQSTPEPLAQRIRRWVQQNFLL
jgi:putative peptide zinc metalloprotease protein